MMDRPDKDDAILLCMPIGFGPVAAGSLRKLCNICNQPIAASRASLEAVIAAATRDEKQWWLVCLQCAPQVMDAETKFEAPTAAQIKEVVDELERRRDEDDVEPR